MASLFEYYNTNDDDYYEVWGANWRAMQFTPVTAHKITSVKLKFNRVGSPGTLCVDIKAVDGSGFPTGAALCSGTTNGNTLTDQITGEWREITLGSGFPLISDKMYAIICYIQGGGGDASNCVRWHLDITSPTYPRGNGLVSTDSGSSWSEWSPARDYMFEDWGDAVQTIDLTDKGIASSEAFGSAPGITKKYAMAGIASAEAFGTVHLGQDQLPVITVRIAFASYPFDDTPEWTDVSADFIAFSSRRGRQYQLDRIEAGSLIVTLKNESGKYFPKNTDSPYYLNIKPGKKIQIRAIQSGMLRDIFTGYIESWEPKWLGTGGKGAVIDIRASDATKLVNAYEISASYSQELSGTRIGNILDDVGFPSADRSLDTGQETIIASSLSGEPAMGHIYAVQDSELSLFYFDRSGNAVYEDRHHRQISPHDESQAIFSDDAASKKKYGNINFPRDDELIYNIIKATRVGGATQTAQDTDSQDNYGPRSLTRSGLLLVYDLDAWAYSRYMLARYKDSIQRVREITIYPDSNRPYLYNTVLEREISDRVTIIEGDSKVNAEYFVEGIEHNYDMRTLKWKTNLRLSDAEWYHATPSGSQSQKNTVDGNGDETGIHYTTGSPHWQQVDETDANWDGNASYVANDNDHENGQRDLYAAANPIFQKGEITNVRIYAEFGQGTGSVAQYPSGNIVLKTGGTVYSSGTITIDPGAGLWEQAYYDWATNPATGEAWTWDDINSLQIGISLRAGYTGSAEILAKCTAIWYVITFNTPDW